MKEPLSLFCSYAHDDAGYLSDLQDHLAPMRRERLIEIWSDLEIVPGTEWDATIAAQLERASIVVLLITPRFIQSDYAWGREMHRALERHEAGEARVVPVIVRPVDWQHSPLAKLQAVPKNAKPITTWRPQDLGWLDVATGIRRTVEDLMASLDAQPAKPDAPLTEATPLPELPPRSPAPGLPSRAIYDAAGENALRGRLIRAEGDAASGDAAADATYDGLGAFYDFFWQVYERDSIDDRGRPLTATVHYGTRYDNAFWTGETLVVGDGSGLLVGLTLVDVLAAQLTFGIISHVAGLEYYGQSGALVQSIGTVFGVLVKQHSLGQTADQADWLLGQAVFGPEYGGGALASLAAPGTAYDSEVLGKDPQPRHLDDYVDTTSDNGGVHMNAGIPNHAFYRLATALGGFAWERAGRIWYEGLKRLRAQAEFADFAAVTLAVAAERFGDGSAEHTAVRDSWTAVGVATGG
jgi:hypothetical protein